MATITEYRDINNEIKYTDKLDKAEKVIEWAKKNGRKTTLTPIALEAAMSKQFYGSQSPGNYLEFLDGFDSAVAKLSMLN